MDNYNFGVEIEFGGSRLSDVYDLCRKYNLPVRYCLNHKLFNKGYDKWILDVDRSVSKNIDGLYYGGEFSSRILKDDDNSWLEVKKVCNLLKEIDASINRNCSSHITIDMAEFMNDSYFFEILCKIFIIFEAEIDLFYQGDNSYIRNNKEQFAGSINYRLFNIIYEIDFNNFYKVLKNYDIFKRSDGLNMSKYYLGLLEVRYPNGTINFDTIYNNVNFSLKLIDAIRNYKFDIKYLDFIISSMKKNRIYCGDILFDSDNYQMFEYLVSKISNSNDDYNNFTNQYKKVLSNKI